MPLSLRFARVVLCVQGSLIFAFGLFLLATPGPDVAVAPYARYAIVAGLVFAACVATGLSLRTGRKSAAITAIVLEILWAAGAADSLATSNQGQYLTIAICALTLIAALTAVAGLIRSPARRYYAAR